MLPWIHRCAVGAVLSGTLLLVSTGSIRAQEAPVPGCGSGAATDSTAAIQNKLHHVFYSLLFVPPLVFSAFDGPCEGSASTLGFWNQSVSVSLSASYLTNGVQKPSEGYHAGGQSASIEVLIRGVYGEVRVEEFSIEDGITLQTIRLGHLSHPFPRAAAGVTVGYRRGPRGSDLWDATGIELALPIIYALGESPRSGWIRWEPTYVVTSSRLVLAPRVLTEFPVPRTPFVARIGLDVKGVRARDPVAVSSGLRLRI
jgi:hypothetical protein